MIEKNIFQLSKNEQPPFVLRRYVNSFKNQVGFKHEIYSDQKMDSFIKSFYPEYLKSYQTISIIEKTDLIRLLLVYHFGGLYSDLDTYCRVKLEVLFNEYPNAEVIVGLEANVTESIKDTYQLVRARQICNWTFAAKKKSDFIKKVIDRVIYNIENYPDLTTMEKTGPAVISDIVFENETYEGLTILPTYYFCAGVPYESQDLLLKGYIIHKFWGSWKKDIPIKYRLLFIIEALSPEKVMLFLNNLVSKVNKIWQK